VKEDPRTRVVIGTRLRDYFQRQIHIAFDLASNLIVGTLAVAIIYCLSYAMNRFPPLDPILKRVSDWAVTAMIITVGISILIRVMLSYLAGNRDEAVHDPVDSDHVSEILRDARFETTVRQLASPPQRIGVP
jgi:branched-subunit amino acid ABC-type transport system permease component